ncbi:MAG: hypothetical protein K8H89_12555 [Flavobacteriales bacterium]|jgi:hypothetical protein|nr:hypothetical protein [Flavobacteriales bacterium]MCB0759280.1 hypothetical protein [Flavobacteriales bacterium]
MSRIYLAILIGAALICIHSCKRDDDVKPQSSVPVDGRQKFVGVYDIYDTLGSWKYEMEISLHEGEPIDSLFLQGWGGGFDVYAQHHKNDQSVFLNFVGVFGIEDYAGNRWALFSEYDSVFMYNRLIGDTLRMSYVKDNIAFYVADGVPYFRQSYREFAVKRE